QRLYTIVQSRLPLLLLFLQIVCSYSSTKPLIFYILNQFDIRNPLQKSTSRTLRLALSLRSENTTHFGVSPPSLSHRVFVDFFRYFACISFQTQLVSDAISISIKKLSEKRHKNIPVIQ